MWPRTRITARAGLSDQFPENTLPAFRQAVDHGADRLELDVHVTLDRKLMLHHFYELGETDNGEGLTFRRDSAYLRTLDAGGWMSPRFQGERIPFLEEVFAAIGGETEYELDLKGFDVEFLSDVLALVHTYKLVQSVELTSPYPLLLMHARRLEPQVRVGMFADLLLGDWMPLDLQHTIIRSAAQLGSIDVVHCPCAVLNDRLVADLHADGRLVHAANCNSQADLEQAFALGVDQLSTNHVDLAVKIRAQYRDP